ncbi:hypothetical protein FZEAL_2627 [Fusarium zealandicum]|uniref:F-box domain-containing protein n=1 Tax=Fusarium zealandicum TaxID=1053134 RepID=A0A8H4UR55_9HYPO|nr:hypothetical protein FZEAL_2627 [Fusarium zealandicum]
MDRLPNELIAHILSFLDSGSTTDRALYEDPATMSRPVQSGIRTPLKNASLVCRCWRSSVLNLLFRHVFWSFQRFYKPAGNDIASQIEVLDFLRRKGLSKHVDSLTIFIDPPSGSGQNRYADGQFWGVLPPRSSHPEAPMSWNILWSVLSQGPQSGSEDSEAGVAEERVRRHWDNNWFWHAIFHVIDPLRITLVSSADIVSSLLSRSVDLTSEWAFDSIYYILSLSRITRNLKYEERWDKLPSQQTDKAPHIPCDLVKIRDWTSLLINEGSFASVYSLYEFFHYAPPTLLPVILDAADPSFNTIHTTLHSFSYIATFPLSHHIADFLIPACPPVERLYVQFQPKNRDFWESDSLSRVDRSDLWLESDASHSLLMRQILDPAPQRGWEKLKVFESGDTQLEGAWRIDAYDALIDGVNGWREENEGFFVRDTVPEVADDELEGVEQGQEDMEALTI